MPIIKSKRFVLRPLRKGDEKSLVENINDKDIYRYTLRIPHPYTMKHAKQWINSVKKKDKTKINLAIVVNGEVVGGIGLNDIQKHKAEIGYWLGKKYWNKGVMTKAVKLVTDFGFRNLKLKRIYAHIRPENKASIIVLERNRFKLEGLMRKEAFKDGKFIDALLYAKINH